MNNTFENFSLAFEPDLAGCQFSVRCDSLVGESAEWLPFEKLRRLETKQKDVKTRRDAVLFGTLLFEAVLTEKLRPLWRGAAARAWEKGHQLRLVLEYPADAAASPAWFHEVPWELLFDPERDRFLALDSDVLLVRYLRQERPVPALFATPPPLRALFTAACPADPSCALLRLAEEMNGLKQMFRWPAWQDRMDEQLIEETTLADLGGELRNAGRRHRPFQVWHHCGHGRFHAEANEYQLALEGPSGANWVGARKLIELIASCRGIELVFLNVCLGSSHAGLGTLLAALGVPAVIGHAVSVEDRIALHFSQEFWRAFATMPVDCAVRRGRQSLAGSQNELAFAQVVLFLRGQSATSSLRDTRL